MSVPQRRAAPARLFFGVFTGFERLFDWVREEIQREVGELDPELESPVYAFPETRTYAPSMGPKLERKFFFLAAPLPQDGLARMKHLAIDMEERARQLEVWPVDRPINVDPGILNECRVILASTKDYAHRIYRGDGVWEEITMVYRDGRFETLPWTYPDFREPDYHAFFTRAREKHLAWLRSREP